MFLRRKKGKILLGFADKDDNTALHIAASQGNMRILKVLHNAKFLIAVIISVLFKTVELYVVVFSVHMSVLNLANIKLNLFRST